MPVLCCGASAGKPERTMDILLLGPTGGGKSLLAKQLAKAVHGEALPGNVYTKPESGMEVHRTVLTAAKPAVRVTLREIGGVMGMDWGPQFAHADLVLFVVDAADRASVSRALAQLLEALATDGLRTTPVAVCWNKCDLAFALDAAQLADLFRLDAVEARHQGPISRFSVSAVSGSGIDSLCAFVLQTTRERARTAA